MISRRSEATTGPRPRATREPRFAQQVLAGLAATAAIVFLGSRALSSMRPLPARRQPLAVAARPEPAHVLARSSEMGPPAPAELPEMPSLLVGPPDPQQLASEAASEARGPMWNRGALPPIPGSVALDFSKLAPNGPAIPREIVPRNPDNGGLTASPDETDPRPARAAETSSEKPLSLQLTVTPVESSPHGPGTWLRIRATASVACYIAVFHVNGDRRVSVLFPRRFDIVYRPNVTYTLMARAEPGEAGEVVLAVASVYPIAAADALAAVQSSRALAPASARGLLSAGVWDAVEQHLRGRASGEPALPSWERHAWRVAVAGHRAPVAPPSQPPQPAGGGAGGGADPGERFAPGTGPPVGPKSPAGPGGSDR
jgi:hypothetical protein